jgi:hypothetical protein
MSAKVYRHFAVVTVAVTAAMGMFADGETRDAAASEIAAHDQQVALARANAHKFGEPKLIRHSEQPARVFGDSGFDGAMGEPMDEPDGGEDSGVGIQPEPASGDGVPTGYTRYGLTSAEWAALAPEQREKIKSRYARALSPEQSLECQEQTARLLAASQVRSGRSEDAGNPDD